LSGDGSHRELLPRNVVEKRIHEGNIKRANLKKGVIRRCLGNVRSILVATCLMTAARIGVGAAKFCGSVSSSRPDILEIFAGHAEVSMNFSRWGSSTMEPVDQIYGMDLTVESSRERVKSWIVKHRPRLVLVEYPSRVWSPIMNLTHTTPQARRRLQARRLRERPFLEFCEEIFTLHLKHGGDALAQNPLRSKSFDQPPMKRWMSRPDVYHSVGHGCRYGVSHIVSGKLLIRPTVWISTSPEICDQLSLKCQNLQMPGHHDHDLCLGGSKVTSHAGRYTKQIAKAVHRGYIQLLKRREPGRICQMLRWVRARLRRDGVSKDLRWYEKPLKKAIDQWSAVFVAENQPLQDRRRICCQPTRR
jgi:hypothetical protein